MLAIYPSSHRNEDLLPYPEVFWNLRLSCVSLLPSFFCCPSFQHTGLLVTSTGYWVFFVFTFHHWSFCRVGFLLCLASALLGVGQAGVVSVRLSLSHSTRNVRGMCNFLGSVSPQQRFEMADWCYSSVTAQSFIRQAKESTPWKREGRLTPKERTQSVLLSSFYTFVSLPP